MAWPTVIINILNMMRGPIPGVEFHFLFVVYGTVAGTERNLIMVDNTTDFADSTFDNIDPVHMLTLKAAQLNGKQNWTAGVIVLDPADSWQAAVFKANETSSFEAVVLDKPDTGTSTLEDAVAFRTELKNKLGREVFMICTLPGINDDSVTGETWAEWLAATVAVPTSIASEYITVVPQVHKENSTVGIYAGRLANGR
ncbi:DUF2586 family protein [Vibrio spartinae]|uniref:Phage tail sheath protein n=1 Tax=Vibrio spartinae TaxID=1918945 RepID=A0A1N6MAW1_9VIBR|nr:DUF2586 family protein [Vibrio spartinae]SIO96564.1 hypothetical protein VSP9026_04367 [Vibrio spartinae]